MEALEELLSKAIMEAQPQGGTGAQSLMPEDAPSPRHDPLTNYGGVPGLSRTGAIAKLSYTHDAMVDQILANPTISQGDLGRVFGYSAPWVSRILASDAFQARLAERSEEIVDPTVRQAVEEQFKGLIYRSLEILQNKLNKPPDLIPDNLALRTLEIASRAAGYGGKTESAINVKIDVNAHLEDLGGKLTGLLKRKKFEALEDSSTEIEAIAGS